MGIKYITRVIGGLSMDRIMECVSTVHEKSGKNKLLTLIDMFWCSLRYGAGFHDYTIFEYYKMNGSQRNTYMTRIKNKKFMNMMNDQKYAEIFDDKAKFYHHFEKYLGRRFLDLSIATDGEIKEFLKGKNTIIAKPCEGECGHGIEKIELSKFATIDGICKYLKNPDKGFGVVEEVLVQHEVLNRLYPYSANCLRMVTLLVDGVPHVLYAVLKTGNNGKFVDNLENGGFACHFDIEKGEICGPGHTSSLSVVNAHPMTGVEFMGYKIPYVNEAVQLVKNAAKEVPSVRYIGWDVCITENGPAIIEGNNYAAYDFPQLPDTQRPRVGLLAQIRSLGVRV